MTEHSAVDKTQALRARGDSGKTGIGAASPPYTAKKDQQKHRGMENRLAFTISAYIYILFASAGFTETYVPCDRSTFDDYVNNYCIPAFNQSMASTSYRARCPWPNTRRSYIMLDMCVGQGVRLSGCMEPSIKDEVFLGIHKAYFPLCSYMQDPDLGTLLLLVLPCILTALILPFTCTYLTACRAA
ncbi:receptor activity-modifying protein 1-like isoform X1 [Anguilla anguilla]|uniref:receptor activity-modifying protein 1-like isoform X1 n=2 Tax=Anguilla anguilla TaxID=7936 RepID=UPI0015AC77A7|nr:receptor activity-modifying protein 1-like isoform X1 [Anguilla anguilla]